MVLFHLILNHIDDTDINALRDAYLSLNKLKFTNKVLMAYIEYETNNTHIHSLVDYNLNDINTTVRDNIKKIFKKFITKKQKFYEHVKITEITQIKYIFTAKEGQEKTELFNEVDEEKLSEYEDEYPVINKKMTEFETYKATYYCPHDDLESLQRNVMTYLMERRRDESKFIPISVLRTKAIVWCQKLSVEFDNIYTEKECNRLIEMTQVRAHDSLEYKLKN